MKRLLLGMMAMMMLVLSGCGDASVAVVIPAGTAVVTPPSIETYRFTKDPVTEYIDGSVDFYAPESDIDTMTVVVLDPRGYEISRSVKAVNFPGTIEGTIHFTIDYSTYPSDFYAYTFSIYLTDFDGYTSNQAVDTFLVP